MYVCMCVSACVCLHVCVRDVCLEWNGAQASKVALEMCILSRLYGIVNLCTPLVGSVRLFLSLSVFSSLPLPSSCSLSVVGKSGYAELWCVSVCVCVCVCVFQSPCAQLHKKMRESCTARAPRTTTCH